MEATPLLVVHGIGNRSEQTFQEMTAALQLRMGGRRRLIYVYWGDLGGISEGLEDALPSIFPSGDDDELKTRADDPVTTSSGIVDAGAVISARVAGQAKTVDASVRSASGDGDALRAAIVDAVNDTDYIRDMDDVEALLAIGDVVAAAVSTSVPGDGGMVAVRGRSDGVVASIVKATDAMIGKITGNLGGTLNQTLRRRMAVPVALTLGDVVGYHQNRKAIHQRLFARLDSQAPGWGTPEKPINVMAHSLGGLLVIDAALGAEGRQLVIDRLVTFGSQAAFFHVMTPRNGLKAYEKGKVATLPKTVGHWTNLWHRMDVLAFTAKPVFRLADGSSPVEVDVTSSASEIVALRAWLHSCYWESPELLNAWR